MDVADTELRRDCTDEAPSDLACKGEGTATEDAPGIVGMKIFAGMSACAGELGIDITFGSGAAAAAAEEEAESTSSASPVNPRSSKALA